MNLFCYNTKKEQKNSYNSQTTSCAITEKDDNNPELSVSPGLFQTTSCAITNSSGPSTRLQHN
ncbi:hypothetical protein TSUD_143480 [Trifolium subterraneum]|uniref:Uncharacterized protein n=1 Tax=Trifolium subterraneum TaxID=3900 RepID=A0A2Z6MM03_TRISU|nr:hypothetical protein TSUD_143480 [Trifolium subterraneum]